MPANTTSRPNLRSTRIVDGRSWIVAAQGGALSMRAHANESRMNQPFLPLPIQNPKSPILNRQSLPLPPRPLCDHSTSAVPTLHTSHFTPGTSSPPCTAAPSSRFPLSPPCRSWPGRRRMRRNRIQNGYKPSPLLPALPPSSLPLITAHFPLGTSRSLSAEGGTVLIEWERPEECDSHSTIRWIVSKSGTVLRHRHCPPHEY